MAEINLDALKTAAGAYLDASVVGEVITGVHHRELVVLAMSGFAAQVLVEHFRDVLTGKAEAA